MNAIGRMGPTPSNANTGRVHPSNLSTAAKEKTPTMVCGGRGSQSGCPIGRPERFHVARPLLLKKRDISVAG